MFKVHMISRKDLNIYTNKSIEINYVIFIMKNIWQERNSDNTSKHHA